MNANVDHAPGQDLVLGALPQGVEIWVDASLGKGFHPALEGEILAPRVQPPTLAPDRFQQLPQPPVATSQHRFDVAGLHLVPVVLDGLVFDGASQQVHPPVVLISRNLRLPLEWRKGLGHKEGGGDGNAQAAALVDGVIFPRPVHLLRQSGDADDVLIRLGGQTQHEIQLHRIAAALEGGAAGL